MKKILFMCFLIVFSLKFYAQETKTKKTSKAQTEKVTKVKTEAKKEAASEKRENASDKLKKETKKAEKS